MTTDRTSTNSAALLAREARVRDIRAVFEAAGYAPVSAPVLQPADVFLDMSGEDIRRRMYLFNDPGGAELCLRPELTIPVCRLYLENGGAGGQPARLCSEGPVYRYQPAASSKLREFSQTGVECLGVADAEAADAEVMVLAARAVAAARLTRYDIAMGDLALFDSLVDALDIPAGWRGRLKRFFWRPDYFRALIDDLAAGDSPRSGAEQGALLSAIAGLDEERARALIEDVLKLAGIAPVGGRTVGEVAERLLEQAEVEARTVPREAARLIADFLGVSGPLSQSIERIKTITRKADISIEPAVSRLERRLALIEKAGIDLTSARFATGFGRNMAYYTGFVFEFRVPAMAEDAMIAGGGRYDGLLQALGAPARVPAVGCAIGLERLLAAAAGEGAQ